MSNNYFSSPAPNPMSTSMKLIHFEKIDFDNSIFIPIKNFLYVL